MKIQPSYSRVVIHALVADTAFDRDEIEIDASACTFPRSGCK
jgi:hypothetical protein